MQDLLHIIARRNTDETPCATMPLWKWATLIIAGMFVFLTLYGIVQAICFELVDFPANSIVAIISGAMLLCIYAGWVKICEKRSPTDLLMKKAALNTGKGLLTGVAFFSIVVFILMLTGCYRVVSIGGDYSSLVYMLSLYFLVACGEEIAFRGLLFRMIDERFCTAAALIVSAVIFGGCHIIQPNATLWSTVAIAIEGGILLGMAYKYSQSLWLPIGIHWAWNFTQGNVFGFAVSGIAEGDSILHPVVSGPELLTGGTFGPEASCVSLVVGIAISLLFAYLHASKTMASDDAKDKEHVSPEDHGNEVPDTDTNQGEQQERQPC